MMLIVSSLYTNLKSMFILYSGDLTHTEVVNNTMSQFVQLNHTTSGKLSDAIVVQLGLSLSKQRACYLCKLYKRSFVLHGFKFGPQNESGITHCKGCSPICTDFWDFFFTLIVFLIQTLRSAKIIRTWALTEYTNT